MVLRWVPEGKRTRKPKEFELKELQEKHTEDKLVWTEGVRE